MHIGVANFDHIRHLREIGQQLWLDSISRKILGDGTLKRYIREFGIVGLTSNPTIFQKAIHDTGLYDDAIVQKTHQGLAGQELFFELAIEDLRQAASLFLPIYKASHGLAGWVSLEVSPLLVDNTQASTQAAVQLHQQAASSNMFIKIPGTRAGLKAIEESIFRGIPINVTLLFSCEQYLDAAHAYMCGIQRRIERGLDPKVHCVASLFVSRWDALVKDKVAPELQNRLGIAVAQRTYKAYRDVLESPRWAKLAAAGALPQRLLWASTGAKDPGVSETLYVQALASPNTINTMPEKTLLAFARQGKVDGVLARDGGDAEQTLRLFKSAGVNEPVLASRLQSEGAESFARSWHELLDGIAQKSKSLGKAAATG